MNMGGDEPGLSSYVPTSDEEIEKWEKAYKKNKEGKMSHKDWDGVGWYKCWNSIKVYISEAKWVNSLQWYNDWTYQKLENFEPPEMPKPKPPKPELEDGVYLVRHHMLGGTSQIEIREKLSGLWSGLFNVETNVTFEVIGRIPVEPIE